MINVSIDVSLFDFDDLKEIVTKAAKEAEKNLAQAVEAKAKELANQKLHERRRLFIDALNLAKEVDGTWVLSLDGSAAWIDDGMPAHDMLPGLLNSAKAKTGKDGSKYLVVPFQHGPGHGPSNTSPESLNLVDAVRKEMKRRDIPWSKIEKDSEGKPLLGKLHKIHVGAANHPLKDKEGPNQGHGAIGSPRQGNSGIPYLDGAAVFQHEKANGKIQRTVTTFRIASSKQQGKNMWQHPGLQPVNIFSEVADWAEQELETNVIPALIDQISSMMK